MPYNGNVYTDQIGQTVADFSKDCYSSGNKFSSGQCTWYCWGRAFERYGGPISVNGNGGQWYANIVTGNGVSKIAGSSAPVSKSIAVFPGPNSAGHVIFIEQVDGSTVYFTHANYTPFVNGQVYTKTIAEFKEKFGTPTGYIVLSKYNPPTGG